MRTALLLLALAAAAAAQQPLLSLDLDATPWRYFDADRPEFARADFDDSAWPSMPVPVRRNGYRWFRKRIEIPSWADTTRLTLLTSNLPAFAVYLDGVEIGTTGSLTDLRDYSGYAPRRFDIPPGILRPGAAVQIAIRSRNPFFQPIRTILSPQGRFRILSRELALADPADAARAAHWLRFGPTILMAGVFLAMALLSAAAWRFSPERPDLLWFAGLCFVWFVVGMHPLLPVMQWRHYYPGGISIAVLTDVAPPLLAGFVFAVLRIRSQWPLLALWTMWVMIQALPLVIENKEWFRWPFYSVSLVADATALAVLAGDWVRNQARFSPLDRALRLTLVVKVVSDAADWIVRVMNARSGQPTDVLRSRSVGPFFLDTDLALALPLAAVIFGMLIRTVTLQRDEQRRLSSELEAARTVQQLLLPTSVIEGVDAFYQPAAEVGGDFYHVVELPEGSKLVVIGDVSGKGLRAAMLVSVCVGILRNEKSKSPAAILAALNEGLVGHAGGGFVTCSCARFDPDGAVTLANAGHPSPYCDGKEIGIEAGLPLGIVPGLEYAEYVVRGERFTFVSDGVVEAENAQRELFGFDRTCAISMKPAQEIAEAARAWGQTDDITVVTVRRIL